MPSIDRTRSSCWAVIVMTAKYQILAVVFFTSSLTGAIADESLEQRVANLEARVIRLEHPVVAESAPKATKPPTPERKEIVITAVADGSFILERQQFDLAGVSAKLKELALSEPHLAVIMRAGKKTDYKHVADLLDACKSAGFINIAFAEATLN